MSSMMQRIITGAIFGIVVIGAILFSSVTFGILLLIIASITLYEYNSLQLNGANSWYTRLATVFGILYFFYASGGLSISSYALFSPMIAFVLFAVLDIFLNNSKSYAANAISGIFLVSIPLAYLHGVTVVDPGCIRPITEDYYHEMIPLSLLFLTWANDVGAYFIGKFFGKRKLFERISPNKTWGGFYGGLVFTVVVAITIYNTIGSELFDSSNYTDGVFKSIILGFCVSLFATFGDLFQSYIKRLNGVKDSGNILPGHGGFWDRFDGFLFVIYGYMLFQFIQPMLS